jgi:hypothetical protein
MKCRLCGRRGHIRKDCPGLDDGGAGQSKFKGKYSRLPASARGGNHGGDDDDAAHVRHWWPALSKDIAVSDWYEKRTEAGRFKRTD